MPSGGMPSSSGSDSGSKRVTVPATNTDPTWSLCPWPVDIELDRKTVVQIRPTYAVDWLKYLLRTEPDITGLIEEFMPVVSDYFFEHELPLNDFYGRVLEVIGVVSARPWWVAMRLIGTAVVSWQILGPKLMFEGVDATKVSLAAWLDALLFLIMENMEEKDVTMFTLQLEAPPPLSQIFGEDAPQPEPRDPFQAMETKRSDFLAMAR